MRIYNRRYDKKRRLKYRRRWSLEPKNAERFSFIGDTRDFCALLEIAAFLSRVCADVCRRRVYVAFR